MQPHIGVGWEVPRFPSVSSSLLLAVYQSLHTLPLRKLAVQAVGMVQSRAVPGTPAPTLRAGTPLMMCLHMASQEQRHPDLGFSDSPSQGHVSGTGGPQGGSRQGLLPTPAPCPVPLDMCPQLQSGVSTGPTALHSLWSKKWLHQIRSAPEAGPVWHAVRGPVCRARGMFPFWVSVPLCRERGRQKCL